MPDKLFKRPDSYAPVETPEAERFMQAQQAQFRTDHPYRAKAQDAIDNILGFFGSYLGGPDFERDPRQNTAAQTAGEFASVLPGPGEAAAGLKGAGVAFPALLRAFHGTPELFEALKAGRLFHAAEEPAWAATFARRSARGTTGNDVIMPVQLDVKNALDLTPDSLAGNQMHLTDLRHLAGQVPEGKQINRLTQQWKMGDEDAAYQARDAMTMLIEKILGKRPDALQSAGFDGIRYLDGTHPSWAVTDPMQVINAITRQRGVGPGR